MDGQNTFYTRDPLVYSLITDTFTELINVFDRPRYFAICTDEAWAAGYHKGLRTGDPVADGLEWISTLTGFLRARGVQPLMAGDMLLNETEWLPVVGPGCNSRADCPTAQIAPSLPKDIIIADWHYRVKADYPSLRYFQSLGFPVLGCCYGLYGYENITNFSRCVARANALGVYQTSGKLLHNDTGFLLYSAESAWNGGQRTVEDLGQDLDALGHEWLDPLLYPNWQNDCLDFRSGRPIRPPFASPAPSTVQTAADWGEWGHAQEH